MTSKVKSGLEARQLHSAPEVASLFSQAIAFHQAGLLTEAEQLYREILLVEPAYFDGLHMLGVIAYQRGDHATALQRIDEALKINPGSASAHNNRGVVLAELKRFEEAAASYDKAIALSPNYVDALCNRGNALKDLKRFDEALTSYDGAIALKPDNPELWVKRGIALTPLHRFEQAIASFDRALALRPTFIEALNNRGLVLAKLKRFAEAIANYDSALSLQPNDPAVCNNRGQALLELGRLDEALAGIDRAIALDANNADAFNNRGRVLAETKRFDEALASYSRAIALRADYAEAFNNRGNALLELKRYDEALANYDLAIKYAPSSSVLFHNRGNALIALKRHCDALASYDRAIALEPDYADALNNRGNLFRDLGRLEEALESFDRAILLRSDHSDAFSNRGNVLRDLRRFDEALASHDRAIALNPNHAEFFNNRAIVLADLKRFDEALASYARAIALRPDYAEAFSNRGFALRELKRFDEAVASFGEALARKPEMDFLQGAHLHVKMHVCDWTGFTEGCARLTDAVKNGVAASLPLPLLAIPATAEVQLTCAKLYASQLFSAVAPPLWKGERYAHSRIRVAYVSSDLRDHPVAHLTAGLFERHDRSRFETIAISYKSDTGPSPLRRCFDRFVDAQAMSDQAVAKLLRDWEVDIAVDLNGFTEGMRPLVFGRRPAPVQVNYLGFAGTLGQSAWDYVLADRCVIPDEARKHYAEQVVYLPETFMPTNAGQDISATVPSRRQAGLPDNGVVFCSFNNSFKITPDVFDVWMRLLCEVDGSVLWLAATNATAPNNLRREAERRGVSADRLIFANRTPLRADHLARQHLADLFLDTVYYNAHATAADALWAGVPVVTCIGATFASRVAGSLLEAIGLPELVTRSLAEYESLARTLARDPNRLAGLREKLARQRMACPLFDTERFARHIESAYIAMWERAERGEPPQSFAVTPLDQTWGENFRRSS
jgi:protein O-GlcNAc transferase